MKSKSLLIGVTILVVLGIVFSGCSSGVSQEAYDEVVAECDAAEADLATAEAERDAAIADLATAEAEIEDMEAEIAVLAEKLLPNVLPMLGVVDEIEAWAADPSDTALFGALAGAVNGSGDQGLISSWGTFQAALTAGDPGMTLFQFYGYMLGECSYVAAAFPAEVQPLMGVGDEMAALVAALDIALLGQMTDAVNASGDADLMQRWNNIISTFATDLPGAMAMMADMQVWLLSEIAEAAPETS